MGGRVRAPPQPTSRACASEAAACADASRSLWHCACARCSAAFAAAAALSSSLQRSSALAAAALVASALHGRPEGRMDRRDARRINSSPIRRQFNLPLCVQRRLSLLTPNPNLLRSGSALPHTFFRW